MTVTVSTQYIHRSVNTVHASFNYTMNLSIPPLDMTTTTTTNNNNNNPPLNDLICYVSMPINSFPPDITKL